ncbi:MAG: FAD-dependent oxidoreductase, partial [Eubacterium sp.]|nr:FAD-dependent oxidoreductase [Eubacterium sp.]
MGIYDNLYDMIIIGGGPAGLTAAIYASRAKEKVLVIENNEFGGQIALTDKIENYPGVLGCSGRDLIDIMKNQAKDFGAELIYTEVKGLELESRIKKVHTTKETYRTLSVVLALGGAPGQAGFVGETAFKGRGVSYCPTCDGALFAGCPIYVVGGGPAAVEESIYLSNFSTNITLVVRGKKFSCDRSFSDRLKMYPNIKVLFHTEIIKVSGDMMVERVTLRDNMSEREWDETAEDPIGVFVFVGYHPNTAWLPETLERDEEGYLLTDSQCRTSVEGVCAAGDVRQKTLRQVVTATADGAIAAVSLEPLIRGLHEELDIPDLVEEANDVFAQSSDKA